MAHPLPDHREAFSGDNTAVRTQAAVTAYLKSKQLLLFVFAVCVPAVPLSLKGAAYLVLDHGNSIRFDLAVSQG